MKVKKYGIGIMILAQSSILWSQHSQHGITDWAQCIILSVAGCIIIFKSSKK